MAPVAVADPKITGQPVVPLLGGMVRHEVYPLRQEGFDETLGASTRQFC